MSSGEDDSQSIIVRRSHIFSDALRTFSRATFDIAKFLKVTFVGKSAVDEGGPRREFFCLLIHSAILSSMYFEGRSGHLVPVHSLEGLSSNKFYIIGKMLSTPIVQGGVASSLLFFQTCC